MNDIVLTSLTNLFALFVSSMNIDHERGKSVCADNLRSFCSERAVARYVELFSSLYDMYAQTAPDYEQMMSTIFIGLRSQIPVEEQVLLLLRLMELVYEAENDDDPDTNAPEYTEALFRQAIENIGLDAETCEDIRCFIDFKPRGSHVAVGEANGIGGRFAVLLLRGYNQTLVTYDGDESLTLGEIPMRRWHYMVWPRNGIIKSGAGVPIYYTPFLAQLFGTGGLSGHNITFTGRDIDFRFPGSDNGLHHFSFDLHSGQLVAVMGGSGVGKSTLFNILNGTQRPDSGQILINGEDSRRHQSLIGFVPQDDLLIEELTVWQNLMFTARLCFRDESETQLADRVRACLTDLDLMDFANLKVGSPLNKTISGGQRKRLNIALELIREPSILFLDEPTSGLSSADSEKVIHLLKKQTYSGRLVLANIHQPSSDIYKLFDHLWMLDRGGYPIYDGNPIEAITYFKTAAHKADADSAVCPSCGNVNPEVMMDIIEEKSLDSTGRVTTQRKVSPQEWHEGYLRMTAARLAEAGEVKHSPVPETSGHVSVLRQFAVYLQRTVRCKMANRQFMLIATLEAPLLATIVACLTRYSGEGGYSLMDNHNLVSYYFMAIIVAIFMGMSLTAEEIFRDRALLRRERFLHLSFGSYIYSKIVFTAIVTAMQTLLFIAVGNTLLGIRDLFAVWWLVLFTCAFLAGLTGLFLSRTLKSVVAIYITIPILLIPQILLCGVVVPFGDLNPHSRTGNVPIVGDLIPSRWAFEALAVANYEGNEYNRHFFDLQRGQYELQFFSLGHLRELRSVVQQAIYRDEHGDTTYDDAEVKPLLRRQSDYICRLFSLDAPHDDSLLSYARWIDEADSLLTRRSQRWMRALDKEKRAYIDEHGQESLNELQRRHTNRRLEMTLVGRHRQRLVRIEGDAIVPLAGAVYLDPMTHDGRAPFYSHVKLLGPWRIPTLWFNLAVLWAMCLVVSALLFRKQK